MTYVNRSTGAVAATLCEDLATASGSFRLQSGSERGPLKSYPPHSVVLVSDDEVGIVRMVGRMCDELGKPWVGVTDLVEAAEAIVSGAIERMVLDWRWPLGAPRTVQEMCIKRRIPVVIYTGYRDKVPPDFAAIEKPGLAELREWLETPVERLTIPDADSLARYGDEEED